MDFEIEKEVADLLLPESVMEEFRNIWSKAARELAENLDREIMGMMGEG